MNSTQPTLQIDRRMVLTEIEIPTLVFKSIVGQVKNFDMSDREGMGEFRTEIPVNVHGNTFRFRSNLLLSKIAVDQT